MKPVLVLAAVFGAAWSAINGRYRRALILGAVAAGTAVVPHRKGARHG